MAKKTQPKTIKRAAIYVRVSSERQAKGKKKDNGEDKAKTSPDAQEKDCRALCERNGYQVVNVYRDVEKYRVGKQLVEPSGTRADRPGLRAMLAAARAGELDVIVAWREDRLYRSYRPMLDVLECLDETGIDIELAKETFDKRIAPVKAWAAKMELDAKHDRFMMGVALRFEQGKAWNFIPPYGYTRTKDGEYIVNPVEAKWVVKIFEWYAEGVAVMEIRRRLVASGAKQRKDGNKRPWHLANIRKILGNEYYWTGKHVTVWDGESYAVDIPPLVSVEMAQAVAKRKAQYKVYPAGRLRQDVLATGIIYCAGCGTKMKVITATNGYRRKDGTVKKWTFYDCNMYGNRTHDEKCCARAGAKKIDAQVWDKVWKELTEPGKLEADAQAEIERLKSEQVDAEGDVKRLTDRLGELGFQRQVVITWGRTKVISQDDMETQLATLDWEAASLQSELSKAQFLTGNRADRLLATVNDFRGKMEVGRELLELKERSPEQEQDVFEFKRGVVRDWVERVDVLQDKTVKVHFVLSASEDEASAQCEDHALVNTSS